MNNADDINLFDEIIAPGIKIRVLAAQIAATAFSTRHDVNHVTRIDRDIIEIAKNIEQYLLKG